jgi:hypothetical protein
MIYNFDLLIKTELYSNLKKMHSLLILKNEGLKLRNK